MPQISGKTLASLGLLNGEPHGGFDRQTRLARLVLDAEVSLMTIIDDQNDRQFFRSTCGVAEPLRSTRVTPLSHSFCKLVRDSDSVLVVADSRSDERVWDNPAITEFGVVSYLGAPIHGPSGDAIGSLCVFSAQPRDWTEADQTVLRELAAMLDEQILLVQAVKDRDKAMAEAQRQSDARARFVASVGHEVRTPLNGVMGLAQLLAEDLTDPAQKARVQAILESGDVMLQILNDLLDLSKMEAGKMEFDLAPFRPIDLANRLEVFYSEVAERKGLDFEVMASPGAKALWLGDETRINQILQNLVSNALKFTDTGAVSVKFSCVPGRSFRLVVSDTGIGMSPEATENVFADFGQADATISHRYGGTGLGLSIVKHLVTAMGGTITVNSVEGRGTEFTVVLPLQVVEPTAELLTLPSLTAVAGMTVLAVDDNLANLQVITAMLEHLDLNVKTAQDGVEALAMVGQGGISAVFMDIAMPRMDGQAAAMAIRAAERHSGKRPMPLIAVTADALPGQVASCRDSGFDDVISKPINSGDIARAVRLYLLPLVARGANTPR